MSAEQREAVLEGAAKHESREAVDAAAARADGYFDEAYPVGLAEFINAFMRESWRADHGNTYRWDKVARAGGVMTLGKVILG